MLERDLQGATPEKLVRARMREQKPLPARRAEPAVRTPVR